MLSGLYYLTIQQDSSILQNTNSIIKKWKDCFFNRICKTKLLAVFLSLVMCLLNNTDSAIFWNVWIAVCVAWKLSVEIFLASFRSFFLGGPTWDESDISVLLHWHCGFHAHRPREIHELFSRSSGKKGGGCLELLFCLQHLLPSPIFLWNYLWNLKACSFFHVFYLNYYCGYFKADTSLVHKQQTKAKIPPWWSC